MQLREFQEPVSLGHTTCEPQGGTKIQTLPLSAPSSFDQFKNVQYSKGAAGQQQREQQKVPIRRLFEVKLHYSAHPFHPMLVNENIKAELLEGNAMT